MDIRIFALFIFVAVLGSYTEARSAFSHHFGHGGLRIDRPLETSRLKREIGEATTKPTTTQATTTPAPTDPTTTPATSPTTTPSTEPTTTPTTTTEATSPPTTTPTTTSATTPTTPSDSTTPTTPSDSTTPTTPSDSTTPTTPLTTTPSTTPESTKPTPTKKPTNDLPSRSNFDEPEPEDSTKKPGPSEDDKAPTPGPYFGPGAPETGFGQFGPGFDPYFGYPGFNSIPGSGPNYAWTGTNNGPGYSSAGASAGSFAGAYPGTGYPMTGYPTADSPSLDSRGGFQDNSPNPNGYNYGGVDPLYNAAPGFYFPGQFPNYHDPTFDMIRQIQAQIQAQHQAMARSMAFNHANQDGSFAPNTPNYAYSSVNMNNMRPRPTFDGSFGPDLGNSNMDLHNRLASNYDGGNYGGGVPQISSASIGLGPHGGFQMGQISPVAPGIDSRFAEDLPPPSGNSFGVFASSSSSSMTGPDGRPINHKSSITGVNDNGKVSFRTVHD